VLVWRGGNSCEGTQMQALLSLNACLSLFPYRALWVPAIVAPAPTLWLKGVLPSTGVWCP